jgi:hypothetical protein
VDSNGDVTTPGWFDLNRARNAPQAHDLFHLIYDPCQS